MSFRVSFDPKVICASMNYNELDQDRPLFSSEFNAYSQNPVTFAVFNLFLSQVLNDSLKSSFILSLVFHLIHSFLLLKK